MNLVIKSLGITLICLFTLMVANIEVYAEDVCDRAYKSCLNGCVIGDNQCATDCGVAKGLCKKGGEVPESETEN